MHLVCVRGSFRIFSREVIVRLGFASVIWEISVKITEPGHTTLLRNFPNPFNPETWIAYDLGEDAHVSIRIYDARGGLIRLLDVGRRTPGAYRERGRAAYWDGRDQYGEQVATGVYFFELEAGGFGDVRRMVVGK